MTRPLYRYRMAGFAGAAALSLIVGAPAALATPIANFDGLDVMLSAVVTDNGRECNVGDCFQDAPFGAFSASISGANTATVGGGVEFVVALSGTGLFSSSSGLLNIDIQSDGTILAAAQSQFAIGSTRMSDFSFDLLVSFSDPSVQLLTAVANRDLVRGDHSVSGLDPIVWTFVSELDNSFGNVMTFTTVENASLVPSIAFTGETTSSDESTGDVPAPGTLALLLAGLGGMALRRRRATRP
ncbi:MAG: PEP-CTERM sorting domain-containing protein [Alphaproteobacteria bacterium]